MFGSLQLLGEELNWHDHDKSVWLFVGQTMSDGTAEAHFDDILIDSLASQLLLPFSIARLAVVRRHIHQSQVNELLQDLELLLGELECLTRSGLPFVDVKVDILAELRITSVPQFHQVGLRTGSAARLTGDRHSHLIVGLLPGIQTFQSDAIGFSSSVKINELLAVEVVTFRQHIVELDGALLAVRVGLQERLLNWHH